MDRVNNLVTADLQIHHGAGQKIPSGTLNSRLEDTTADQLVPAPLASESVLAVNRDASFLSTPWCGEQLELWPLPADQSATG